MPPPHDRSTHSAFAGTRWREGGWGNLDRRLGETRNFVPASSHCPSGKLHPRRFDRGIISSVIPSEAQRRRGAPWSDFKVTRRGWKHRPAPNAFEAAV